jgi:hypothetical protein
MKPLSDIKLLDCMTIASDAPTDRVIKLAQMLGVTPGIPLHLALEEIACLLHVAIEVGEACVDTGKTEGGIRNMLYLATFAKRIAEASTSGIEHAQADDEAA